MIIGNHDFEIGKRTYLVGILNVTPDSFSDGGRHRSPEEAVAHAKQMVEEGADIIEVGGESTRPGFAPVDAAVQLDRVIPVLRALRSQLSVPIAIDTFRAEVAEAAIREGASLVNDVTCFTRDPRMPAVCAEYHVACCAVHNRDHGDYTNFPEDVLSDLRARAGALIKAGVTEENIILDPGIGFAKNAEQNLEILRRLDLFTALNYPVMLGASRKRFLGLPLGLPAEERLEATLATTVIGISKHCDFIRVHDVKENKRACVIADPVYRRQVYG